MAALTGISGVRPTVNTQTDNKAVYGETVGFGDAVYFDTPLNKWMLIDADNNVPAAARKGVAMTPGVDTSFGIVAVAGDIILVGAAGVVGETYYAGPTPGDLIPDADRLSGDYVIRICTCIAANTFRLNIETFGVAKP